MLQELQKALAEVSFFDKKAVSEGHEKEDERVFLAAPFFDVKETMREVYPSPSRVERNLIVFGMTVHIAEAIERVQKALPEGIDSIELAIPAAPPLNSVQMEEFLKKPDTGNAPAVMNPTLLPGNVSSSVGLTPLGAKGWAPEWLFASDIPVFPTRAVLCVGRNSVSVIATVNGPGHMYTVTALAPDLVTATKKALVMDVSASEAIGKEIFGRAYEVLKEKSDTKARLSSTMS